MTRWSWIRPTMELYLKNGLRMERDSGYISLQGEGHPIEFRKVDLMELRD
jgi:hypothetical protein